MFSRAWATLAKTTSIAMHMTRQNTKKVMAQLCSDVMSVAVYMAVGTFFQALLVMQPLYLGSKSLCLAYYLLMSVT